MLQQINPHRYSSVYIADQALKTLSQCGNMMNAPITSTLHFQTLCPSSMA